MVAVMSSASVEATNDPAAHKELRAAHDGGYRFPERFAGFTADVSLVTEAGVVSGRAEVRAPREIELTLDAPESDLAWVRQELGSMAGHRWPSSYEQGDGRWTITLGPDDANPLGRFIDIHDDPFNSSYRVRDGRISQVNRQMGGLRFSIAIQRHTHVTNERVLPSAFTVSFWDNESGRLTKTDSYTDEYVEVDAVWLPAKRRVVTSGEHGQTARELVLSNHTLLTGASGVTGEPEAERRQH